MRTRMSLTLLTAIEPPSSLSSPLPCCAGNTLMLVLPFHPLPRKPYRRQVRSGQVMLLLPSNLAVPPTYELESPPMSCSSHKVSRAIPGRFWSPPANCRITLLPE
jgi:hypothetical protein